MWAGGASSLANFLLDQHFTDVSVLDISGAAIQHAKRRLGSRTAAVTWLEADVTDFQPPHRYHLWHDRAVFHFLTSPDDRRNYMRTLKSALVPGGHVILATFALDGPPSCSGLPVARHDTASIRGEFGAEFTLIEHLTENHLTPWGTQQRFAWFHLQRESLPLTVGNPQKSDNAATP